jgi:hypothetical protein
MSNNSSPATVIVTSSGNCAGGNFNGHFDTGNCSIFNGWALDMNNFGRTVLVEIRVDGAVVATVSASEPRPDLGAYFGNPAATPHGWSYSPPANAPRFAAAMAEWHKNHLSPHLWRNF